MSTFTYVPDFGANGTTKPDIRKSNFGDGYEQRQAFGINSQVISWNLDFNLREDAEADLILAFFETAAAVDSFDWTPPAGDAGKYVCTEWSYTVEVANRKSISAKFEKVYEP